MESKHRYYQCMEVLNYPGKSVVDIFRQYHHMYAVPKEEIKLIPTNWIDKYKEININIEDIKLDEKNWFDKQVLDFINLHGAKKFKKLFIWNVDWTKIAENYGSENIKLYKDPRSLKDKIIHKWLLYTQNKLDKRKYRRIDKLIKYFANY